MSKTLANTYTTGVTLSVGSDDPTTITATGLLQQGLEILYTAPWQIVNQGTIQAPSAYGVYLQDGGTVTNRSSGYIGGDKGGIVGENGALTVINAGAIASTDGAGVSLKAGGLVTNLTSGTITGYYGILGGPLTVVNSGSIAAYGGRDASGVDVQGAGSVTNEISGRIAGSTGIYGGSAGPVTVVNDGVVTSTISAVAQKPSNAGIALVAGGSVTNTVNGTISGYQGIYGGNDGALTVVNAGTITAYYSASYDYAGVSLGDGGSVTNEATGTITGGFGVASDYPATATVVNYGYIKANSSNAVNLGGGGYVANHSGGIINGYFGVVAAGSLTVANAGTIIGSEDGAVVLFEGGSVTNVAGGTITGYDGIIGHQSVTVVNAGSIVGTGPGHAGVRLEGSGSITNQASGTITGYNGIVGLGNYPLYNPGPTTVVNAGSIAGTGGDGVSLYDGGSVTNEAGGTISGSYAIHGGQTAAVTVVNYGALVGNMAYGSASGVYLAAGGSVTNLSSGTISGYLGIIGGYYGPLTVVNEGVIAVHGDAVVLEGGGSATNQASGTITGYEGIVAGTTAAIVVNYGVVEASRTAGVFLAGGGSVTNQNSGTIGGGFGVLAINAAATVVNAGTITADYYAGVGLLAGGYVTNQSGGTITGYGGILGGGPTTVVNAGDIAASGGYGFGVSIQGAGSITNVSGGTIAGSVGVYVYGALTVVNAGTIQGDPAYTGGDGIVLLQGSVTNQSGGTIGGYHAIDAEGALTVVNAGTIAGYYGGIGFAYSGYISNLSGGTISGPTAIYGVALEPGAVTVVNAGSILGGSEGPFMGGVVLLGGATIVNQYGGTITGYDAIYGGPSNGLTVSNAGGISGYAAGIILDSGGYVTNQSGGVISGYTAITTGYLAVTVVNAGTVVAGRDGIDLNAGGSVTNQAGGTISGYAGIDGLAAGMTVVNAGSIIGTGGTAVQFAAGYSSLLTIDPGGVFAGIVDGGNTIGATATSTLELASGTSIGVLSGLGRQFVDFGQITVDSGAYWVLNGGNSLATGTTLTIDGTLAVTGATLYDGGSFINDGGVIIDPSSVTLDSLTGTGDVTIDSGSTLVVTGAVGSGETIVFAGTNGVFGVNPTAFAGQINGFGLGDTIGLAGVSDGLSPQIVNGNTLEIQRSDNPPVFLTLDPSVDYTGDSFAVGPTGAVTETPCFVTGTLIRTDRGDVAVERLSVGDLVVTASGSARPVGWIGHRTLDLTRHAEPRRVQPIAVRAHAFGDGMPARDLFLSPEHAVLLDGVLVPVRLLVNGGSIQRDESRRRVTYYHVELETHDILLAEGLAVESYLETGNRGMFENAGAPLLLHPDPNNDRGRRMVGSCAPFADDPERVEPLWRVLAERAAELGWGRPAVRATSDDPALHLVVDGRRIAPVSVAQGIYVFVVPEAVRTVRLRSRVAVPSDSAPWVADERRLGVLLRGLTVRSGAEAAVIALDDPRLGAGWWQAEWHDAVALRRWTDGDAVVPMPGMAAGTWLLEVDVAATLPYPLPLAAAPSSPIRCSA